MTRFERLACGALATPDACRAVIRIMFMHHVCKMLLCELSLAHECCAHAATARCACAGTPCIQLQAKSRPYQAAQALIC